MARFVLRYEEKDIYIEENEDEEDEDMVLADLFARFAKLTMLAGYQPGSWENLIEEVSYRLNDNLFPDIIDSILYD